MEHSIKNVCKGDAMECCNDICANIEWISILVLKDVLPIDRRFQFRYQHNIDFHIENMRAFSLLLGHTIVQ